MKKYIKAICAVLICAIFGMIAVGADEAQMPSKTVRVALTEIQTNKMDALFSTMRGCGFSATVFVSESMLNRDSKLPNKILAGGQQLGICIDSLWGMYEVEDMLKYLAKVQQRIYDCVGIKVHLFTATLEIGQDLAEEYIYIAKQAGFVFVDYDTEFDCSSIGLTEKVETVNDAITGASNDITMLFEGGTYIDMSMAVLKLAETAGEQVKFRAISVADMGE